MGKLVSIHELTLLISRGYALIVTFPPYFSRKEITIVFNLAKIFFLIYISATFGYGQYFVKSEN